MCRVQKMLLDAKDVLKLFESVITARVTLSTILTIGNDSDAKPLIYLCKNK